MMSAMLCMFGGGSFHFNCGETSGPSQVNFFGIASPAENVALEICRDIVPPFSWAKDFPESQRRKQKTKPTRPATLMRAVISWTLLRRPMAAQKFSDFGMAALLRETN